MAKVTKSAVALPPAAARAARVIIVASRFNADITQPLADGARATLEQAGIAASRIELVWVPGAFELPVAAAVAAAQRPSAIVALGCLIKGQTPQYLTIADAVAWGLTQVGIDAKIPVTFGVIVADSVEQARERCGGAAGHRGAEAAAAAVAMLEAVSVLQSKGPRTGAEATR
jgi:6,7-dimethyl-8-ribityllumazine synthase